jgi:prevent-host-death family protein
MNVGVRQAKTELTKLINAAIAGETVIITNHGKPLVRLVPEKTKPAKNRGYGCLKGILELPPGWDSPEADAEFEDLFDHVRELKKSGRYVSGR